MTRRLHAEIAGGGLGALAAAAALGQRGWSVRVHEKQSELRTVGAGIYIWENGLRVLETIGAYDNATRDTHRGVAFESRGLNNEIIEQVALTGSARVFSIPRNQLLDALAKAAISAGAEIVTRSEVIGATPAGELLFAGGRALKGDLVLGADGVSSCIRHALSLDQVLDRTTEGAIRLIIPSTKEDYESEDGKKYVENWNGPRRLLITPISRTAIYLALTCPDSDAEARQLPVNKELWKRAFPAWAHYIDRISDQGHWDVYSVVKVKSWSQGNTAILGDAAHAQTPNLGQGGGMAMQNALALAVALESVKRREEIPSALMEWERRERPIIEHCQKWASLYGEIANLPDRIRSVLYKKAMSDPWVAEQIFKAANHVPTGYRRSPAALEASTLVKSKSAAE
jgi:2-polyprenyl-6-methoxyphenol hydroxylase-like FAD-dependent oxidoreductase